MTNQSTLKTIQLFCLGLFLVLPTTTSATNSGSAQQSLQKVEQALTIRRETQKKEDSWDSEKKRLTAHYQALQVTRKNLLFEQKQNQTRLNNYRQRVEEAERKTIESARLRKELTTYLSTVVERVDNLTATSLPFLISERNQRLSEIKKTLLDPEIAAAFLALPLAKLIAH